MYFAIFKFSLILLVCLCVVFNMLYISQGKVFEILHSVPCIMQLILFCFMVLFEEEFTRDNFKDENLSQNVETSANLTSP
jgi:hypothetical protein